MTIRAIIAAIGAGGPENVEESAVRIVARLEAVTKERDEWRRKNANLEHAASRDLEARKLLVAEINAAEGRWEKAIEWMCEQRYAAAEKQDFDAAMAFRNAMDYLKKNRPSPPAGEKAEGARLTELQEIDAAYCKPFHKAECQCEQCMAWHSSRTDAAQLGSEDDGL
jgi:hypothetical protein